MLLHSVMMYVAYNVDTTEEFNKLTKLFDKLDKKVNQKLSREELKSGILIYKLNRVGSEWDYNIRCRC